MKQLTGTIVNGNCLKITKDWPDGCVKLVVTDPPYQFMKKGKELSRIKKKSKCDKKGNFFAQGDNRKSLEKIESTFGFHFNPKRFLNEIFRICKPFNAYIFTNKSLLEIYLKFAREHSLFYDILIWNTTNAIPINKGHYLTDKNYCVFLREKGSVFHSDLGYKNYFTVYTTPILRKMTSHPTEKPLPFIRKMIQISSNPKDIVFDGFAGSGTTLIGAEQLGRQWIGIEINKEYCEMAEQRMKKEKRNPGFRIFK